MVQSVQKQIDDAGSFVKALQQGGVSAEQLQNGLKESYKQLSVLGALSDDALKDQKTRSCSGEVSGKEL